MNIRLLKSQDTQVLEEYWAQNKAQADKAKLKLGIVTNETF